MISIIICSRIEIIPEPLKINIQKTIGFLDYEIIVINNSNSRYSIFEAYNKGASMSKFPYLCFMHDDIIFDTEKWGEVVISLLDKPYFGVLGVAGSLFKSEIPSSWWVPFDKEKYNRDYVLKMDDNQEHSIDYPGEKDKLEVVVLDGIWFCCKKSIWEQFPFDEKRYHGFHFYDLDFSLNVHLGGYKNYVTNKIIIKHSSTGNFNADWIDSAYIFHSKWKDNLPISLFKMSEKDKKKIKNELLKRWLGFLNSSRYKRNNQFWFHRWRQYYFSNPLKLDRYTLLFHRLELLFGK